VGAASYPFIAELNYDEFHSPFRCTKISNDSNELQVCSGILNLATELEVISSSPLTKVAT